MHPFVEAKPQSGKVVTEFHSSLAGGMEHNLVRRLHQPATSSALVGLQDIFATLAELTGTNT